MSKAEIEQMYSDTIKLCQDNKINSRNTWNLNLIDYMGMLFRTDNANPRKSLTSLGTEEEMNFHRAGVTLDAGVKIYCSRVDSVHTNAFKVLGGLCRTDGSQESFDAEDNEADDGHSGDENAHRKGRGKRTGRVTLETNLGNITSQKVETDLAVDPLFQKMSAAFDEGGAKGMLLNNLPVGPRGQVVFDSGELADCLIGRAGENGEEVYDVSGVLPADAPCDKDTICTGFLRFYCAKYSLINASDRETPATDPQGKVDGSSSLSNDADIDFEYGNNDLQSVEAIASFGANGTGAEMTFALDDGYDEDDVNMLADGAVGPSRLSIESNISLAVASRRGSVDLVEAGVSLNEDSEYAFLDTAAMAGWAGPQHWRFRATQASSGFGIGTAGKKNVKRPRGKNAMLLDFSEAAPKVDFAKQFAQGKTETSHHLSNAVLDGLSEKKVTLPEDLHFSAKSLRALFLKPNIYVRFRDNISRPGIDVSRDQPNEDLCEFDNDDNFNDFGFDDGDHGDNFGATEESPEDGNLLEVDMDLVPEPTRVDRIDINYAKVAKKVDVRQLKSGMWSRLCGQASSSGSTPSHEAQCEPAESDRDSHLRKDDQLSEDIREGSTHSLRRMVSELPSFVPESSLSDVSLPYVFICLLHLANEKTLKISRAGEGSSQDLVIAAEEL